MLLEKCKGNLIVISGPSGCGKGTIAKKLKSINPNIWYSVSMTTRTMRPSEKEGENQLFSIRILKEINDLAYSLRFIKSPEKKELLEELKFILQEFEEKTNVFNNLADKKLTLEGREHLKHYVYGKIGLIQTKAIEMLKKEQKETTFAEEISAAQTTIAQTATYQGSQAQAVQYKKTSNY